MTNNTKDIGGGEMSRANYDESCDGWELIMWRGAVKKATYGKRGQEFLKKVLQALEELPTKRLEKNIICAKGEVCAIGALVQKEGGDTERFEYEAQHGEVYEPLSKHFDVAQALTREIMYMNDEYGVCIETPEQRYSRMIEWVKSQIKESE